MPYLAVLVDHMDVEKADAFGWIVLRVLFSFPLLNPYFRLYCLLLLKCKGPKELSPSFELATSFELLVRFQSKASRSTLGLSGISYLE